MSRVGALHNVENNQAEEVLQRTVTSLVYDNQRTQYLNTTLNGFTNQINQQASNIATANTNIGTLSSLQTTNKNNLVTAINEVKQQANDIKTRWASVVGAPLTSTDTQAQLDSKTQTIKNTLATNLTSKGIASVGTESMSGLVVKVANIQQGYYASGTASSGSSYFNAQLLSGGNTTSRAITVSGLNFIPQIIRLNSYELSSDSIDFTIYTRSTEPFYDAVVVSRASRAGLTVNNVTYTKNGGDMYINNTGFRLPVGTGNVSYTWQAWG